MIHYMQNYSPGQYISVLTYLNDYSKAHFSCHKLYMSRLIETNLGYMFFLPV